MGKGIFHRSELLFGSDKMKKLNDIKVIIFGLGGVGSWCAESLVRTGVQNITIVDSDRVSESNINRQLMATTKTVGDVKVDSLKQRLLEINPDANITPLQKIYSKENHQEFDLDSYDFIIDAIDSLSNKCHLIRTATKTNATLISSMGAALKIDPTRVKVDTFWNVRGCPLARKIRKLLRKIEMPTKDFLCVYSDEVLENHNVVFESSLENNDDLNLPGDSDIASDNWSDKKAAINGSLAHVTGIFGLTLAGLVLKSVYNE